MALCDWGRAGGGSWFLSQQGVCPLSSPSAFCLRSAAGCGQFASGPAQPELRPGHGAAPGPAVHDVPAARPAV